MRASRTWGVSSLFGEHERMPGEEGALEAEDEGNNEYILEPAGHHLAIA